jgi:hypothetical protein
MHGTTCEPFLLPSLQAYLGRHLDTMANAYIRAVEYIRIPQDAPGSPRLRQ